MALPLANVAKYELTLPSQQKTINFRPFLVKEEKILLMAMESGESKEMISAIKEIVKSCTFGELNAEDHPMFDIEYVFLQIRAKSVGVDLSQIEVFVDDDHSSNVVIDEDRKLGVTLKYPSLKDIDGETLTGEVNIEKTYKMIENSIESIYEGETVHMAKDLEKKEVTEFLENLTAIQMRKLTDFYNSMPRLEHKVQVTNPKTKVESEVTLKGLASFFV